MTTTTIAIGLQVIEGGTADVIVSVGSETVALAPSAARLIGVHLASIAGALMEDEDGEGETLQ